MSLVNMKELLHKYPQYRAFCAFNVINLETLNGVVEVGEELGVPLIIMITPKTLKYAGIEGITYLAMKRLENSWCDFVLHLDHAKEFDLILKCIKLGFTSIMYDGSNLSLEDNIKHTKEIVKIAHSLDVSVEGEIGSIGGKEDENKDNPLQLTKVDEALTFWNETNVDILAPAIGTVHGLYKGEPHINFELIKELKSKLNVPLALHGGSDLPESILKEIVNKGFKKINIGTDLMLRFAAALGEYMKKNPELYDIREIMKYAKENMKDVVKSKINAVML